MLTPSGGFAIAYGSLPRVLRIVASLVTAHWLFPYWECFVPNVGIIVSQRGNYFSLTREKKVLIVSIVTINSSNC